MTRKVPLIAFLLLLCLPLFAQLQANFEIDKPSGCSLVEAHFTNKTAGASANVAYSWDLGNGNSSTLVNPGATYTAEGIYQVILTAVDGGNTSTISKTIIVYKKPRIAFSVNSSAGCVPLNVKFTSNVTSGDGIITNYLWDFGDGITFSTKDQSSVSHIYTVPQQPPVSLTATNSYGCISTLTKTDIISVSKAVIAEFSPVQNLLCRTG